MKNIKISAAVLAISAIGFTSCSKDDDSFSGDCYVCTRNDDIAAETCLDANGNINYGGDIISFEEFLIIIEPQGGECTKK